jgi:hypothetical protein
MTRVPGARRMRLLVTGALTLCASAFILSACGDDSNGGDGPLQCGLDTGNSAIFNNITVGYSATLSGAGTVTSITYTDNGGDVVVDNPTLPFQANVTLATLPARIRASGSVTTGTITIGYTATGSPDRLEQDSQTCEQTNN